MIIRLRFVLVIFFVISVPTVFFFWFDGDEESSDVTFTDRQGRVYESSLALQLSENNYTCLLYTSPSPRDDVISRMPSSA